MRIIILVPTTNLTGPIRGAIALANGLASDDEIFFVALSGGLTGSEGLDSRVNIRCPGQGQGFFQKLIFFRAFVGDLKESADRSVCISYCFSADLVNLLCDSGFIKVSSVRGNLPLIYRLDYGILGWCAAYLHLFFLRRFESVISMSHSMKEQLRRVVGICSDVIPNFIDERSIPACTERDGFESGRLSLTFLASLSKRKQPLEVLRAFFEVRQDCVEIHLNFVGDGPMRGELEREIIRLGLGDSVTVHGQLSDPFEILLRTDVFVLPSLAEGTPRAALEALHCGVPCILGRVDGNIELIETDENGWLVDDSFSLVQALRRAIERGQITGFRRSLLPASHRQQTCVSAHKRLFLRLILGNSYHSGK
jgi:glycosyltransferase involved in cell wall biosynthesis